MFTQALGQTQGMKKINNSFIGFILILFVFSGCAGMFMAGIPINADKYYPEFIGIKLTPLIYPAAVINNGVIIYIHMPYDEPYGQFIAKVPERTVITIDHVIRKYNVENEIYDYVMGRIDVPGYSGFVVVGVCDGREHWALDRCIDLTQYKIMKTSE